MMPAASLCSSLCEQCNKWYYNTETCVIVCIYALCLYRWKSVFIEDTCEKEVEASAATLLTVLWQFLPGIGSTFSHNGTGPRKNRPSVLDKWPTNALEVSVASWWTYLMPLPGPCRWICYHYRLWRTYFIPDKKLKGQRLPFKVRDLAGILWDIFSSVSDNAWSPARGL